MRSGAVVDNQGKLDNFAIEPLVSFAESQTGFNERAEKLNGRLAMIGFISLIVMEVVTGHGLIGFFASL